MKIKQIEFEGTPEEFAGVHHLFEVTPKLPTQATISTDGEVQKPTSPVTVELVVRALTRIALSDSQDAVLRAIVGAGDKGICSGELAKSVGVSRAQLAGVMGALGRRLVNTPGWPYEETLNPAVWDSKVGQWRYTAHPALKGAIEGGL